MYATEEQIRKIGFMHRKITQIWCGQIDPTQAVKITGFNYGEYKDRVFKPILCASLRPSWLYFLLMSSMSAAVLLSRGVAHPTDHYKINRIPHLSYIQVES
ncbi:MAG: hypothetical protein U9N36_01295 [Euryarchaeota archaeon]|nr:hypothetical protein [Euryarchaeota archaeon]